MTPSAQPQSRNAALGLLAALCMILSACAQTPPAPQAKAADDAPSRTSAYAGHFESGCQQLGEAFYTRDLVDLAPAGTGIEARHAKAIHDAEGCPPASLVVIFHMPPVQWTFDGTTQIHGRTVDRILTQPTKAGQLTASHARAGWLSETPTQFLLQRHGQGKGKGLPVDKAVEQAPTKELRLLTSQRLYTSAVDAAPDTYPTDLDLDDYLERKPAP